MIERGGGSIVTMSSSTGAHDASPGNVGYVSSKGGVAMLTKAMAVDHAAQGIRVNALAPGPTDTPMLASVMTPEEMKAFGEAMPIGRLARPEELAAAALFLASDEASYVTGAVFAVDGGQTAKVGMTLADLGTIARNQ
jgi:NAD(P)-dependent dehydrogenase (short-subunit alcohol dehydrogenase family)